MHEPTDIPAASSTSEARTDRTTAPPRPAAPPPQKSRSKFGGCVLSSIIVLIVGGIASTIVLLIVLTSSTSDLLAGGGPLYDHIHETVLRRGDRDEKIVVIAVNGIIHTGNQFSSGSAPADILISQIRKAIDDEQVAAVVLDMNTPGGEVTATDEIHHELLKLRAKGKKTVTCMRTVAASGGYYLAAGTDHIVANRLTMTGSIGVMMGGYNYAGLLEWLRVKPEVYTSGKLKDVLNMARPREEYERELVRGMIQETYLEFAQVVADGRDDLDLEQVTEGPIGDAGIFSGARALELGLVDELGYLEDAIDRAQALAGLKEPQTVRYTLQYTLADLLFSARNHLTPLNQLLHSDRSWIKTGTLYYLCPLVL